jgi:hypothetical protein
LNAGRRSRISFRKRHVDPETADNPNSFEVGFLVPHESLALRRLRSGRRSRSIQASVEIIRISQ